MWFSLLLTPAIFTELPCFCRSLRALAMTNPGKIPFAQSCPHPTMPSTEKEYVPVRYPHARAGRVFTIRINGCYFGGVHSRRDEHSADEQRHRDDETPFQHDDCVFILPESTNAGCQEKRHDKVRPHQSDDAALFAGVLG